MSVTVHLPPQLRRLQGAPPLEQVDADSVQGLIDALDTHYPGTAARLCQSDGSLRPLINVFVDGTNARNLQGMATELREGSEVHIIPAVAGGNLPDSTPDPVENHSPRISALLEWADRDPAAGRGSHKTL
ncbi:MAG: MoaD/ThiS family protein [Anaerolineae bacterium]